MAHPKPFYRVVADGSLYAVENFSFGFSIISRTSATPDTMNQSLCDSIAELVASWFGAPTATGGLGLSSGAKLERVKVNRIGTDGHYMDPDTYETLLEPRVSGAESSYPAPQLSLAVSLLGADDKRGIGGRGRFYLPPIAGSATVDASTGKISGSISARVAAATAGLFGDINDLFTGLGVTYMSVGNSSPGTAARAGRQQVVGSVAVGDVVDTMRSRRRSLVETYVTELVP